MHRHVAGALTGRVTKWLVLAFVLVLAAGLAVLGFKLGDVKNNEASSWLPGSAEATKVSAALSKDVDPNDIPTLVVYHRSSGLTDADFAAMDGQAREIAAIEGVTGSGVLTPNMATALAAQGKNVPTLVSPDGEAAYLYFTFNLGKDGWNKIIDPIDEVKEIATLQGTDVYVGGMGGQAADFIESFEGSNHMLMIYTFGAVILILLVAYRSAFLVLIVITCAGVANLMAGGVVYLLAKYADLTVNDQSQYILGILTIGAGTDYALLLVARYREELRNFEDRHEAMAHALHRAGPAVIASGATVAVGLMCLVLADLNSTASLGPVLAAGVGVTLFVMMVLLPALLVVMGRWIFGPSPDGHLKWAIGSALAVVVGLSLAIGMVIAIWLGGPGGLGGIAGLGALVFFVGLVTLIQVAIEHWTPLHGRPEFGSKEPTQTGLWAKVGKLIQPRPRAVWVVTAVLLGIASLGLLKLDANGLTTEESFTHELPSITAMNLLMDHDLTNQTNTIQVVGNVAEIEPLREALTGVDGVGTLTDPRPLDGGRAWFEAPIGPDVASQDAWDIVTDARSAAHGVDGADAMVGGAAAFYLDTKVASQHDSKVIIPVVLLVVVLILMLLLRAILAPLLLLGTVVLSFGAALGISTLIFEYVLGFHGADPGFPLFAFVFLVALGIDYNIFLMTRVREESLRLGTRAGSLLALSSTGGVITSAGLVLAATFAVLGTLPMVFLAELGLAVALGVLLDTIVVRSVLVTAMNLDLGDRIWWPSKLGTGKGEPESTTALVNA